MVYRSSKYLNNLKLLFLFGELATDEISTAESIQYDFGKIRAATDDFAEANKLGQGGFGAVYRV